MKKQNKTSPDSVKSLRLKAEAKLKKIKKNEVLPKTNAELLKLVQEFEVHQIELEMMNVELQQFRAEVEKGLEAFTELYNFDMNLQDKTKEEIQKKLTELNRKFSNLIELKNISAIKLQGLEQELATSHEEFVVQLEENEKLAAELVIANLGLKFENEEHNKLAAEVVIANIEIAFQNREKAKRAAELVIANKELVFQNREKAKRAAELIIANKELAFQNELKAKQAAELLIANKELEQFAYVATHDLQEPLRMISSYTQLLERRYKDKLDKDANEFIHFAVDGANRLQILINDLLDYSRISSHKKVFDQCDFSDLLGQVKLNLKRFITETKAVVTNDQLPCMNVEESLIIRLFQNLIENAIKYKIKTEFPKIHITCKKKNEFYEFAVCDNGIGIDMQFHDRIFVIFQRLHTKEEYPGTGIGLSICKRIVERHGGKIWFESKPGEGTTFYFTLKR